MGKLLPIILVPVAVIFGSVIFFSAIGLKPADAPVPVQSSAAGEQGQIIMYSLTTCGRCTMKRREMQSAGISFTEYFIDSDPARHRELVGKLHRSGFNAPSFGTPVFEIDGQIIHGNPPLAQLLAYRK